MPNKIATMDLTNVTVVVEDSYYKGDESNRTFICQGGFGCNPKSIGRAIMGVFVSDGEHARIERPDIEKLADKQYTEQEIAALAPKWEAIQAKKHIMQAINSLDAALNLLENGNIILKHNITESIRQLRTVSDNDLTKP